MATQVLERGANASITGVIATPSVVTIGFSWSLIQGNGPAAEIVPCAIVCGPDGRAVSPQHVVFFNQMLSADRSVQYVDDNGATDGDNEQIEVDLSVIPPNVATVAFVLYINPDLRSPGSFDSMRQAAVRVLDRAGAEIMRYTILAGDVQGASAIFAAEIYRRGDEWKFRAVGQGYEGGVAAVADDFGFRAS